MAYSESLARRIRQTFDRRRNITERKMFGGVCFLLHGNICVGVWKDSLIVRIGQESYENALSEPHVRVFDITGRSMTGWVMVEPDGDERLNDWVQRGEEFVRTLPRK